MAFMGNTAVTINWGSLGRQTGRSGLDSLEQAFYDAYMSDVDKVCGELRDTPFIQNAACEYAQKHAAIVRTYQGERRITEISDLAYRDLIGELESTRREAEAYREHWKDALEEVDRLRDEIRVARTLIRSADTALS